MTSSEGDKASVCGVRGEVGEDGKEGVEKSSETVAISIILVQAHLQFESSITCSS